MYVIVFVSDSCRAAGMDTHTHSQSVAIMFTPGKWDSEKNGSEGVDYQWTLHNN